MSVSIIKKEILNYLVEAEATAGHSRICIKDYLKKLNTQYSEVDIKSAVNELRNENKAGIIVPKDFTLISLKGEVGAWIEEDGINDIAKPDRDNVSDVEMKDILLQAIWKQKGSRRIRLVLRKEGINISNQDFKILDEELQHEGIMKRAYMVSPFGDDRELTPDGILFLKEYGSYSNYVKAISDAKRNYNNAINISGDGNIVNTGSHNTISASITINKGSWPDLQRELIRLGISEQETTELLQILEADTPDAQEQRFGEKLQNWLITKYGQALSGAWEIGIAAAGGGLVELFKQYYGW